MEEGREDGLRRDSTASPFARILSALEPVCEGFEMAVFFDDFGETIDYHSYLDPYGARLVAAHHGILFSSANARLAWLGAGATTRIEVRAKRRDTVTVCIARGYFVTVVARPGALSEALFDKIAEVGAALLAEAGL